MSFCECECAHLLSVVSDSDAPWTIAIQAPLSVGFPGQESWRGAAISSCRGPL